MCDDLNLAVDDGAELDLLAVPDRVDVYEGE